MDPKQGRQTFTTATGSANRYLQVISFGVQRGQTFFFTPVALMVGALLVMVVPVVMLLVSQRFFMQDLIVTQLEK